MAYEFSKQQQYVITLLNNIGCCSIYQLCFILHRVFGTPKTQTFYVIRSLAQVGRITIDKEFRWVVNGSGRDQEKASNDTILAVGVAIKTIQNEEDFINMYRPLTGENLIFIANGVSYQILISDVNATVKIQDLERRYTDNLAKARKLQLSTLDTIPHTMLVFPSNQDIRSVFSVMNRLDLTMPHTIVCVKSENIYGSIDFDTFEVEAVK